MSRETAMQDSAAAGGTTGVNSDGETRLCCPFCVGRVGKTDTKHSLSANVAKGFWHCHRCKAGGRGDLSFLGSAPAPSARLVDQVVRPPYFVPMAEAATAMVAQPFRELLQRRGIYEAALTAGVGYCFEGPCAGRVVVPIRDVAGEWRGFSARTVGAAEPKYIYPRGMSRATLLYNEVALGAAREGPVYVVEGVFDALYLWPDAVALLGSASGWQVDRLRRSGRPLVVVLDGDAWREGSELALRLASARRAAVSIRLPPRTDPDDVPRAQLEHAAGAAIQEERARWT